MDVSIKIMSDVSAHNLDRSGGYKQALMAVVSDSHKYFSKRLMQQDQSGGGGGVIDSEPKLESFVIYLLANRVPDEVVRLALHEQFSLPGLENVGTAVATGIMQTSEQCLTILREEMPEQAAVLREWHQTYHLYRASAYSFVKAIEHFVENKYCEALDLFTVALDVSMKIWEKPLEVGLCILC